MICPDPGQCPDQFSNSILDVNVVSAFADNGNTLDGGTGNAFYKGFLTQQHVLAAAGGLSLFGIGGVNGLFAGGERYHDVAFPCSLHRFNQPFQALLQLGGI